MANGDKRYLHVRGVWHVAMESTYEGKLSLLVACTSEPPRFGFPAKPFGESFETPVPLCEDCAALQD